MGRLVVMLIVLAVLLPIIQVEPVGSEVADGVTNVA
jgi:hypothetical protein